MSNFDFRITKHGLIMFDRGDIELVYDFDQVRQHIQQRLNTFFGEWEYDVRIGIPYYTLLEKPTDLDLISYWIRKTILETPGVAGLTEFILDVDDVNRVLHVKFKCTGQTDLQEVEIIL